MPTEGSRGAVQAARGQAGRVLGRAGGAVGPLLWLSSTPFLLTFWHYEVGLGVRVGAGVRVPTLQM